MTKAVLRVSYMSCVLDLKDAITVSEILGKAELYEEKWNSSTKTTSHHIYENDATEMGTVRLLSNVFYQMAKMAGKPE